MTADSRRVPSVHGVRIALVTDTYVPQVNGVTTVVRRIAEAIQHGGHQVAVVAPRYPDGNDDPETAVLRIPSIAFPPYPSIRLSLPLRRRTAGFLDEFKPELVHVHTEGPLGAIGRGYALRRSLPLVTTFHTNFPQYARHYRAGALEGAIWKWLAWFHRPARVTHTPGESVKEELQHRGIPQAVVWGRGVDTHQFHLAKRAPLWRDRLSVADDQVLVLHVGRLAPEKNLGVLIEAWRLARGALGSRAVWAIAGRGPLEQRLTAELPWVRRAGLLERSDLAALYASADLCVLPSQTETCGLVALEAMASGIPVIAADAGGLRESVQHEVSGLLFPADDPHALLVAMARLIVDGPERHAYGCAARARAIARDVAPENEALLRQYRDLVYPPSPVGATACAA